MNKYGLIIFAIVIIFNVLGGIMKKRAEQQKLAKLSGGRSTKSAPQTQTKRSDFATPAPSQRASQAMDRAAKLAARRKAQLDELRSRRQRRAGTQLQTQQQHPQARIRSGASPTPSAFRSTPPQPTPVPAQRVVIRPSAQPKPAPVSHSSLSQHSEHERADTQRLHGRGERLGKSAERITTEPARITPTSSILDIGELTPELLRRMVVLKEIFDLPVSLRDREVSDRL